jgi:hypothetical protein
MLNVAGSQSTSFYRKMSLGHYCVMGMNGLFHYLGNPLKQVDQIHYNITYPVVNIKQLC